MDMGGVGAYIYASRPWSWTASFIPCLLVSSLTHSQYQQPLLSLQFLEALGLCVLLQASGNLFNSYYDHKHGVDNKATAGDRCLVDETISPVGAVLVGILLAIGGVACSLKTLVSPDPTLRYIFVVSMLLAFFYTAPPLKLKYRALGDFVIIICFGPLMMMGASVIITGSVQQWLLIYGIPTTLLTEAILHANNVRDQKEDAKCGITTLAILLGNTYSRHVYVLMIALGYIFAVALSFHYIGCLLTLLSLPLAIVNVKNIWIPTKHDMDAETAKLQLVFSMLLIVGIYFSPADPRPIEFF